MSLSSKKSDLYVTKDLFQAYTIGHFINQPNNNTEFEITRFEEMAEPNVDNVHKHTFYEILWIDEGTGRQTIDFRSYDLQSKSLFFISPGQVHEFEAWKELKGGTIMFTENFFLQNQQNKDQLFEFSFLDNIYFNPKLLIRCKEYPSAKHYIELLLAEKNRAQPSTGILQSLLHILLLHVQRGVETRKQSDSSRRNIILYKQFKNILELNFSHAWTANQYATKLNITQHHLNRIVKGITGKTVGDVIKARSILEAKRLLAFSDYSVSEIAASLNYFDSSYFSKTFKSATGRTPVEFQKNVQKIPKEAPSIIT